MVSGKLSYYAWNSHVCSFSSPNTPPIIPLPLSDLHRLPGPLTFPSALPHPCPLSSSVTVAISLHPTLALTPPAHVARLHFECLTEEGVRFPTELAPAHDAVIEPMSLVLGILPPWYRLSRHYWLCFQLLHMACRLLC